MAGLLHRVRTPLGSAGDHQMGITRWHRPLSEQLPPALPAQSHRRAGRAGDASSCARHLEKNGTDRWDPHWARAQYERNSCPTKASSKQNLGEWEHKPPHQGVAGRIYQSRIWHRECTPLLSQSARLVAHLWGSRTPRKCRPIAGRHQRLLKEIARKQATQPQWIHTLQMLVGAEVLFALHRRSHSVGQTVHTCLRNRTHHPAIALLWWFLQQQSDLRSCCK